MNWMTWSVHRLQLMFGSVTSVSSGPSTLAVWTKRPSASTGIWTGLWISADTDRGPLSLFSVVAFGSTGNSAGEFTASATR